VPQNTGPADPSRRRLLATGGAALVGGTILGRFNTGQAAEPGSDEGFQGLGHSSVHRSSALYGHIHEPPDWVGPETLDAITLPPPPRRGPQDIELVVVEQHIEVGAGLHFDAWTYGGTVPGPTIRATEGDLLRIRLRNLTDHPHNLHFHGAHRPEMDGWEPIPAGGEFVYEIEAGPAGLHPYHCHVAPLAEHIARGLYGMMIVDPPEGRSPAHEVVLVLSGFEHEGVKNAVTAWNGLAGYYDRYPIKVPAGEPVRAYVANMIEFEPIGSFHLHAQTFDVYPAGMGESPVFRTDTLAMGQAERAIIEFRLPHRGRYMFHPHQHHLADRGAMGWFSAV
jgi:nitrite reductase (NO-forming)